MTFNIIYKLDGTVFMHKTFNNSDKDVVLSRKMTQNLFIFK